MTTARLKHAIRKLISRVAQACLQATGRRLELPPDARVLVLAPHPDDESLGCGGAIAGFAGRAQTIQVAFITDEQSSQSPRRQEAQRALSTLGVAAEAIHFMGAPDGSLGALTEAQRCALMARLAQLLGALRPSVIFHPLHCDGSTEHEASFALVHSALTAARYTGRLLEYPVWAHWWPHLLLLAWRRSSRVWKVELGALVEVKRRAVQQHRSQLDNDGITGSGTTRDFVDLLCGPTEYFFERPFPGAST